MDSLDLGLSFYAPSSDILRITSMLTGGGTEITFVDVNRTFQTFNIGLDVTSIEIYGSNGYLALDNISINEGEEEGGGGTLIPEPTTMLLLGLGLDWIGRRQEKDQKINLPHIMFLEA